MIVSFGVVLMWMQSRLTVRSTTSKSLLVGGSWKICVTELSKHCTVAERCLFAFVYLSPHLSLYLSLFFNKSVNSLAAPSLQLPSLLKRIICVLSE